MISNKEKLIKVSPKELCNWRGHDRQPFELDTEQTVNSLLENGQTTPIIIRKCIDSKKVSRGVLYEIIDGERRWHAAKEIARKDSSFKLKALLRNLNDQEAYIVQLIANEHSPLCGYSQALSYKRTIEECGLKYYELAARLGIANATFTRRMCYLEIDERLWAKIANKRNVSTATAANLAVLLNKARKISKSVYEKALDQLIAIAAKIAGGTATRDIQKIYAGLSIKNITKTKKIYNHDGELLFTISPAGSISINKLIFRKIDHNILETKLSEIITDLCAHQAAEPVVV
ncbi:MAG: ParB/RepB/Spo0J family partition protein [Rickettsiaceae bacterium]|nr:ParB/RepB/Spo0J family partition protein [Rickettsiaceae bacterium]